MELFTKQYNAPGTTPGTLVERTGAGGAMMIFDYTAEAFAEVIDADIAACQHYVEQDNNTWIHIQGVPDVEVLRNLAEALDIHALYLEDVIHLGQRPKLDISDQQAFMILGLPLVVGDKITMQQVCFFLGDRYVISVCSGEVDPFELVVQRLRQKASKLRQRPADYLFYALIDTVIDHGFPMLEKYAERIEDLEDALMEKPDADLLQEIHRLRRELLLLRRQLWPQREVINALLRDSDPALISDDTRVFLRDCHDHTIAILEMLQTYWEMSSGMLEVYLSSMSNRMNNVMRLLTVIATLFIPPTFLVGVYGMNFKTDAGPLSMPELASPYGYLMVWAVIVVMMGSMLWYFKRHKWL